MTVAAKAGQGLPPPANLLTMGQQALGMRGQMLQNQNIGNELTGFQAKQAGAQDYLNSVGPGGQVDPAALNRNLQADPRSALAAPDLMQAAQNNFVTQLQAKGLSLDQGVKRLQWAGNATGSLLAQPGGPTQQGVRDVLTDGVKDGVFTAQEAASTLSSLPPNGPQLTQWVKAHFAAAQGGLQALLPHMVTDNNGAYTFLRNTNPLAGAAGAVVAGSAVPMQMTPGQAATPVTLPTPTGASTVTTLGGVAGQAAGGAPAPVIANGPTPATIAAGQAAGHAAATQGADLVQGASQLGQQRAMLQSIIAESGAANTGPIAGQLAKIGGVLQQFGIKGVSQATAYQLTQKSTMQYVGQALQSMGTPTDGKMLSMEMATPNGAMTPQAVKAAGGMLLGGLDYKQAQAQAWTQYQQQNGPGSFAQFQSWWNQNMPSAAVFQMHYLPKEEQGRYWNSLDKGQKEQFANALNWARSQGYAGGQ